MTTFAAKLKRAQEASDSILCVGLDPDPTRLPHPLRSRQDDESVAEFCEAIIEATAQYCCAFKPNLAFFEALGAQGSAVLERVVRHIPESHVVVADGKRGDIGNTAEQYARSIFDHLKCDACTVSPYMGSDAVVPFLQRAGTAAFVLVRTSNPGARELQMAILEGSPLYLQVAEMVYRWGQRQPGEVGFVVGATDPSSLDLLRDRYPDVPFLIPGVGAQGGKAVDVVRAARPWSSPVLVNASRAVLYAGSGPDFADAARMAARTLRDELNAGRM